MDNFLFINQIVTNDFLADFISALQQKNLRATVGEMKLKRLEIIGFKSFMDKTVVTFDRDITGIVGPNGCGKSNIVDAIRWVMGEQSAKQMRGRSMEDVIFSGSENRQPLSMASVELTFSTAGYQTPAAYLNQSEVSICRRLYRSGESDYFINKIPVRLKDITELFLGTGIGRKAYSVIEQGRIAQVVTAKPEERRYYIEEVAGISKFKSRKEAALRKMEATSQNILRLTDIITELDRQLKSLDRQAKKAEKYKEVKTEFTKWDLSLSSNQYKDYNEKQKELESFVKEFDQREIDLKSKLQEEENSLEVIRSDLAYKEKAINEIQNQLFEVTNFVRLTETNISYKKEEKNKLKTTQNQIDQDIHALKEELNGTGNGLSQINEQKLESHLDEESLKEEVEQLETTVVKTQGDLEILNKTVEELRDSIHQSESRLKQILTLKENHKQKEEDLSKRISRDEEELSQVKKQANQVKKIYHEASTSLNSLRQLKFDLNEKTDELATQLSTHRNELQTLEKELGEVKEELTLRQSRLTSLEELQKNFEGYQDGTRNVMLKKDELGDGIFGTVAEFVETEPEYEGAVSAVLGEKLQYVMVKNQTQGLQALNYLSGESLGRTSIVPMEIRSYQDDTGEIKNQDGVLGPLQNFVRLKDNAQKNLGSFLFGDVVLVEDLSKALDIWTANGHRKTLVTLKGEVVDPTGVITGGSQQNTSKALLEKKREIKELKDLIDRLKNELTGKQLAREEMAQRVVRLEKSLEALKKNSVEEEINLANQEKDVSHFKKELETLELKEKEIQNRVNEEKNTLSKIFPEIESLKIEQKDLTEISQQNQKLIEEKKSELSAHQKTYNEQSAQLTTKKIELAQATQRHQHLNAEINRLQEEQFILFKDLADKEQQAVSAIFNEEMLDKDVEHLVKLLDKKFKKQTEVESDLAEKRDAFEIENNKIREKELELKEMRREHDDAAKKLNETTLTLTELRGQMKYLVEQCLERHQLLLADIYKDYFDENLDVAFAKEQVIELKSQLSKMGDVNTAALTEYEETKERFEFLRKQLEDLENSLKSLEQVIHKINRTTKEKFETTFHQVNAQFQKVFPTLFQGGKAKMILTDPENILETGVDIEAQPPGKKNQSITLLSGGEKALTAVSLIFAMFQIKPSPFCILDEVDAPLDDVNVGRYNEMLRGMTNRTQFIVITHNKSTMETVDVLYGVTMQEPGVSQLVSVALDNTPQANTNIA